MAYADNELSPMEQARVALALDTRPDLQERVRQFELTRRLIQGAFDAMMDDPRYGTLPPAIHRVAPKPDNKREYGSIVSMPARRSTSAHVAKRWPAHSSTRGQALAMAASLSLLLGGAVGWIGHTTYSNRAPHTVSVDLASPAMALADGSLRLALETRASGDPVSDAASPSLNARAVATFRSRDRRYCRQYELANNNGQFEGLACRDASGRWEIQHHARASTGKIGRHTLAPAGAGASQGLDGMIDHMIEGGNL